jgi:ferredoxin
VSDQAVVELDSVACVGSRWCTTIADRAFVMGDDGKAHVGDLDGADVNNLHEAEDSCPVSAIRVLSPSEGV